MTSELTHQHKEESLSRAHVFAIAGAAGLLVSTTNFDYKIDGGFRQITFMNGRRCPSGAVLDFQLKGCETTEIRNGTVVYDLDADAHRVMSARNQEKGTPFILILCCLSKEDDWFATGHDSTTLRKCCYYYVCRDDVDTTTKKRIFIPQTQILTPRVLLEMMESIGKGDFHAKY